jgi:transposase-like protein
MRHAPAGTSREIAGSFDETYIKVNGRWVYLYRAIDQYGQVIDVLISRKRDLASTRRFFTRALEHGARPTEVNTDRAPAYSRVIEKPEKDQGGQTQRHGARSCPNGQTHRLCSSEAQTDFWKPQVNAGPRFRRAGRRVTAGEAARALPLFEQRFE